jgi:S1-C subfamily serine protease
VDSHRAYLGVQTINAQGAPGPVVRAVERGGPAAAAGIKPGDAITSINGTATPNSVVLAETLANLSPGQTVQVSLARSDGTTRTVTVTLGEIPG